jgi:hypothetical protein
VVLRRINVFLSIALFAFAGASAASTPADTLSRLVAAAMQFRQMSPVAAGVDGIDAGGKCGFQFVSGIARNWSRFTPAQRSILKTALQEPVRQKSRVIGHFRISYDTSSAIAPALLDAGENRIPNSVEQYIDSVGAFFNYAWEKEITEMGFPPPVLPAGALYYDVIISDLKNQGWYGVTNFDFAADTIAQYSPPRYHSYIEVDNDFGWNSSHTAIFFSPGMKGLKVTAAHEFNHAIQLSNFGYWSNDTYFYEITSTWLEDVVFHGVNDYFQYIRSSADSTVPRGQFASPEIGFTNPGGLIPYSRMIWGKFIEKKYSAGVMLQTWYNIRQNPPIEAMDQALNVAGSSFRQAFLEWTIWNAYTGINANPSKYYTEGASFPQIRKRPGSTLAYLNSMASFADSIGAVSSVYDTVCVRSSLSDPSVCDQAHQMLVMVSNIDINSASSSAVYPFVYLMSGTPSSGYKRLSNGLSVGLSVTNPANWSTQENVASVVAEVNVYPDPFLPRDNRPLTFRLPTASVVSGRLTVYTSSMELVVSRDLPITPYEFLMRWDGRDRKGNTVATGVYVYVISVGDETYTGKFAVVRE